MRRRLPWLIVLPLMVVGSVAAHALSYPLVAARVERGSSEGAERSSSGLAAHSVLPLGMAAALVGVIGLCWLFALARGRSGRGASPWVFLVLPMVAFSVQEFGERLLRVEGAPFHAALEPRFWVGLALQLPFGIAALFVAWVFLRVAERIVRVFGRQRPFVVTPRRPLLVMRPVACVLPRIPALALGYPQRGPPAA
jgi:hypothetical protein